MVVKSLDLPGSATHHLLHNLRLASSAPVPASGREIGCPSLREDHGHAGGAVPRQRQVEVVSCCYCPIFRSSPKADLLPFKQMVTFVSASFSMYI